jgi:hypothetical protein
MIRLKMAEKRRFYPMVIFNMFRFETCNALRGPKWMIFCVIMVANSALAGRRAFAAA